MYGQKSFDNGAKNTQRGKDSLSTCGAGKTRQLHAKE